MAGLRERFPPRRVLRLLGWNALVLFVLLALAAGGAEVYLRLTASPAGSPTGSAPSRQLVPGVGLTWAPLREVRHESAPGHWQVSRANSLGFLDREPPDPERAAASCHVTLIGDSFVEGVQVPVAARSQVILEELAARESPALDVTTSAFAYHGTGQINQLAFHDAFARRLSPDVLVLVFSRNDFHDNSLPLSAWLGGFDPDYPPHRFAFRDADGKAAFAPPAADLEELRANRLPLPPAERESTWMRVERKAREWSRFADWLWARSSGERSGGVSASRRQRAWAELIGQRPRFSTFADGWDPSAGEEGLLGMALEENPPPVMREALDMTGFAFDQFRERAERDGVALVILANYLVRDGWFERLRELAAGSGGGGFPSSASTSTSSPAAARSMTRTGSTTCTGTRPATAGRRRPSGSG